MNNLFLHIHTKREIVILFKFVDLKGKKRTTTLF